jgi:predicted nucleotidyltransferase
MSGMVGCGTMGHVVTPLQGLERLRAAASSGDLGALCRGYRISLLTVFGSVGRGEPEPRDLDIGVLSEHGAVVDFFGFITEVIDIVGSDEIDVVHLNRAGPLLRERALVGAIILHEEEPGTWARASTAAVMERLDTDWLRRLGLELLAG